VFAAAKFHSVVFWVNLSLFLRNSNNQLTNTLYGAITQKTNVCTLCDMFIAVCITVYAVFKLLFCAKRWIHLRQNGKWLVHIFSILQ